MKKILRNFTVVLAAALSFLSFASAQTISLTFDDGLNPDENQSAATWNAQILAVLRRNDLESMVFPAVKFAGGPAGARLIQQWSDAGHLVGNHTYSHRSLNSSKVGLADFEADVLLGAAPFERLANWSRMLRFPYLKEGNTEAKRDGIRTWMKENGYRPAYVSIDTSDWYYNDRLLSKAQISPSESERIEKAYIGHLLDRAKYYDDLALQVLGRRPPHVMLLHVSKINAMFLDSVISAFRDVGWHFIPTKQAFADPLYSMETQVLPAGESIVWSLAKQRGVGGLRYPGEDDVYEEPKLRAIGF